MITATHPLTAALAETDTPKVWRRPAMGVLFRRSAGSVGQASSTAASGVPRNAARRSASPSSSARS